MEMLEQPTLNVGNSLSTGICRRCYGSAEIDVCERCEVTFQEKDKKSLAVVDNPGFRSVPTHADAFGVNGAREDKPSNAKSKTPVSRKRLVKPRMTNPYPKVDGPVLVTPQAVIPRPNKLGGTTRHYPEEQGTWLPPPSASSGETSRPQSLRPAIIISHLSSVSFPPQAPAHFNTRGEPIQITAPVHIPNSLPRFPPEPTLRHNNILPCAQHGCTAIILSDEESKFCSNCRAASSQSHQLFRTSPLAKSLPVPSHPNSISQQHNAAQDPMPPVDGDDLNIDDSSEDFQLLYPEPEEPSSEPPPRINSISSSTHHADSIPHHSHSQPIDPSIRLTSTQNVPAVPQPPPRIAPPPAKPGRKCVSPNCDGMLHPGSLASRCLRCVKRDWTARMHASSVPPLRLKKKKTVTWFDMPSKSSGDTTESDEGQIPSPPVKLTIRIPPLKLSKPTSPGSVETSSKVSPVLDPSLTPSTSSQSLPRQKDLSPSVSTSPHPVDTPSMPPFHPTESVPGSPSRPTASPTDARPSTEGSPFAVSGWDSGLSDLSDLSGLEESDLDSSFAPDFESPARPSFKIRIPARAMASASGSNTSTRTCTIQKCRRILAHNYRWKCCVRCRTRYREYQRKRLGIQGRHKSFDMEVDEDGLAPEPDAKPLSPGERVCTLPEATLGSESEEDRPLSLLSTRRRLSFGSLKRCQNCGRPVKPESQDTICHKCKRRKIELEDSPPQPLPPKKVIKRPPLPKKIIPPCPQYVSWSSLLNVFHERILGFLEARQFYQRIKQPANPTQQVTFRFFGEHSVVALDFEVLEKKNEVLHQTMQLKDEIGRIGGLMFLPTYWVTILQQEQGIAIRFNCRVRSLKAAEMKGELEIAVLPDYTHVLFPGQRTIVRFCLVG